MCLSWKVFCLKKHPIMFSQIVRFSTYLSKRWNTHPKHQKCREPAGHFSLLQFFWEPEGRLIELRSLFCNLKTTFFFETVDTSDVCDFSYLRFGSHHLLALLCLVGERVTQPQYALCFLFLLDELTRRRLDASTFPFSSGRRVDVDAIDFFFFFQRVDALMQ